MKISIIVAVAENGVIGKDFGLPWRLPEDLKRFKELTMGKPIIMGRHTFESIGRALPGRANIVITRDEAFDEEGVVTVHGFDEALAAAEGAEGGGEDGEAMVIGGGEIYRMALETAARMYLTEVHGDIEGDTRFPDFERFRWKEVSREDYPSEGDEAPGYSFTILERIYEDVTP